MIRISESVLPGHPDKFCDQIADAIVAECVAADPEAYAQIEVTAWTERISLTGGIATRQPLARTLEAITRDVAHGLYRRGNFIDPARFEVLSNVCVEVGDCLRYTRHVNDQSIVVGWAGYDAHTRFLPPEHFIAHAFTAALFDACRTGTLEGEGPDGKLLVRLREEGDHWRIEHVLVTLQQRETTAFMALADRISRTLAATYAQLQASNPRWLVEFRDIELLINPNGPLVEAGTHGDNGQTGRKLAVDFYGPRVPIGGGALSGKHLSHIDRIGAYAARHAAIQAVASGATTCTVRLYWAPNMPVPLDVEYEMEGRGLRLPAEWFAHDAMCARFDAGHPLAGPSQASAEVLAAPAADFETFSPLAVADHARFFNSWLRRIAPDTHQDQASGDESACRLGGFAAPEERWCRNASNGFITDPWLPVSQRQSLGGSRCGRSAVAANR